MLIKSQTNLDCFIVNNIPCNDEASDLYLRAQRFLLGVAIHSLTPLQGLDGKYISYPGLRRKNAPEPGLGLRLADLSVCRIKSILNIIVIMNRTVILSVSEGSPDIHEKILLWVQNIIAILHMPRIVILSVSEGSSDMHEKIFLWVQNDKAASLGLLRYTRNDRNVDCYLKAETFLQNITCFWLTRSFANAQDDKTTPLGLLRYARNDETSDLSLCFWHSRLIGLQARSAQPRLRRRFLASQAWVKISKSSERCKRESFLTR